MREQKGKKKTILMVHNFYQIGGGEHTVFFDETKMLREHGHKVVEYTRSNDELKQSLLKKILLPFTTIWSFKTYREVKEIIKKEKIDVVHCHNTFPLISPSVYYGAKSMKVPVVQTIHNFRFLCPNGIFYRNDCICEECENKRSFIPALMNKCYRNSLTGTLVVSNMLFIHKLIGTYRKISYIFLTEFTKKKFIRLIGENLGQVFIKPNFVNVDSELLTRMELLPQDKKVFVYVGRLEEEKGIKFLLSAWKDVPNDYVLEIYGDGTLHDLVYKSSINDEKITYKGFCSKDVIMKRLSESNALVFPSLWYETFGLSIVEAMSVGCPIVVARIGNHSEIVEKANCGETFDPTLEGDFIKALNGVIKNRKQYSKAAFEAYQKCYSKSRNYILLSQIYEKLQCIQ